MTKTTECVAPIIVHLLVCSTKLDPTTALPSQKPGKCSLW